MKDDEEADDEAFLLNLRNKHQASHDPEEEKKRRMQEDIRKVKARNIHP
eukprot:CAMPEP_0202085138 /NCGR_PEP_ID=MMETSP0964-20121228/29842_1 /ASSEMBLY_ACC=CAM_ASM_000500 /TAXON_ID=4773 /ORGANISM="Schizochytrium aggregatum, Strain ATCC28209" /LENGTH=48 /DNA_ID= /DNA_START= /DNA_END= /DNA_ORIENTATION=